MIAATAHICGNDLDLLLQSLEKRLVQPYAFSSGSLRVYAFDERSLKPKATLWRCVLTTVLLDFGVTGECDVKIYSGGGGNTGDYSGDCTGAYNSIGLVLDSLRSTSAAHGWQYSDRPLVVEFPSGQGEG